MSDSDGGGSPQQSKLRESLWRKISARLTRQRDRGLRESLEGALESHEAQNPGEVVREDAKSMMLNILDFANLRVDDVMVPRVDIVAIDEEATMRDLFSVFVEAGHSRLPVYRETLDGITGMVHVKDFMQWMAEKGTAKRKSKSAKQTSGISLAAGVLTLSVKASGLHRDVLFVPPSMPATDLLVKMQASHIHLAIVIDEYGGTDGLISIEDLVEVIVGDIADEHDTVEIAPIREEAAKIYMADGRTSIAELETLLDLDLLSDEDDEETDTLAGLVFKIGGRVPGRGEIVRHASGLEFEILDSDPRRVKRLRVNATNVVREEEDANDDGSG